MKAPFPVPSSKTGSVPEEVTNPAPSVWRETLTHEEINWTIWALGFAAGSYLERHDRPAHPDRFEIETRLRLIALKLHSCFLP